MSVHGDLFDWAYQELTGAAIVASSSVVARQLPCWLKGDPDPILLVTSANRPEMYVRRQTENWHTFGFPVLVTYATQKAFQYLNPRVIADIRAAVRNVMLQSKPLDIVTQCVYDPEPVVDMSGFPEGFSVSPQLFVYHASEQITER